MIKLVAGGSEMVMKANCCDYSHRRQNDNTCGAKSSVSMANNNCPTTAQPPEIYFEHVLEIPSAWWCGAP